MSEQYDHSSSLPPLLPKNNTNDKERFLGVRLSLHTSQVANQAGLYLGFCSMKRPGVFPLPPPLPPPPSPPPHIDRMLVHRRVTPRVKFVGTHLYTWMERGTVRVKCHAQEHKKMSPARGPFLESPGKFSGL